MRLVQVAKALGMTGQQLRKELQSVDFGIKPTDREVPDNLAQGIIRFVARKHNLDINVDLIMQQEGIDVGEDIVQEGDQPESEQAVSRPQSKGEQASEQVQILRKLTLDDVSQEAISRVKQQESTSRPTTKRDKEEAKDRQSGRSAPRKKPDHTVQQQIKKKEGTVTLPAQVSVKEFAEKTGVQVPQVIQALMKNGMMANITQNIDYDTAAIIASELGIDVAREQQAAKAEDLYHRNLEELLRDEPEHLKPRSPIAVVMGHVDHGKTSILDALRQTDVVSGEAGGITQHIGASEVHHDGKSVTFLDTPGHEAFAAMRARGAQITDVAILVVSATEGVKDTTIEAIDHIKEAGVPLVVAINKMDLEGADPDRVKGELAAKELMAEDWGGNVPMVPCSAHTKQGISDLIDHVLLLAEMAELKANPDRRAVGTVIESHLDSKLGALASVVVNTGTLRTGDAFICGHTVGKVRAMTDSHGKRVKEVGPSGAVRISGFDEVAQVGDILQVVQNERTARDLQKQILDHAASNQKRSLADLVTRIHEGKLPQLKIVLKADTQGSLEAIQHSLEKLSNNEVQVRVIHGAIGTVTETDVMMASASDGAVVAFHATVPGSVLRTAEREGVEIREYDIIYKLLEDVEGLLAGLLVPEEEEKIVGHIEIKAVFMTKKSEQVVGGKVTDGSIKRLPFRLQRGGEVVAQGRITSVRKVDHDIKEAKEGTECGLRTETNIPIEEGDILEVYMREYSKKS